MNPTHGRVSLDELIAENMSDMIFASDNTGIITYLSQSFERILGYSPEMLIGKKIKEILHKEDLTIVEGDYELVIEGKKPITTEFRIKHKLGYHLDVETRLAPILNEENVEGFIFVSRDVSQRKTSERALEQSEQIYTSLFEQHPDAVYMIDMYGNFIQLNDACVNITGYSMDELMIGNFVELCVENEKEHVLNELGITFNENKPRDFETEINHKDGYIVSLSMKTMPIVVDDEIVGVYGISKDITKYKQAEHELKLSSQLFVKMKESVFVADENEVIISVNPSFVRTTGLSEKEVLNRKFFDIDCYFNDEKLVKEIKKSLDKKGKWEGEIKGANANGEMYTQWVQLDSIHNEEGNISNYIAIFRDISEKEQIQQDVHAAGKLQRELLPEKLDNEYLEIHKIYQPSQYVSGDFYDYKWNEEEKKLTGILIDVMGHGVATALQTSAMRVLFQETCDMEEPLSERVSYINNEMIKYFTDETFAAIIYFEYHVETKVMKYVSGGINNFITYKDGEKVIEECPGALIGIFEGIPFEEEEIKLDSGQDVYFLTDGVFDILPEGFKYVPGEFKTCFSYLKNIATNEDNIDDCTVICVRVK